MSDRISNGGARIATIALNSDVCDPEPKISFFQGSDNIGGV